MHLKDNIKLNLSDTIGVKLNSNLEYYINKIIFLNKKMSIVYIWLALISIICGLSFSIYASSDLLEKIDDYIAVHNNMKK